MALFNKDIKWIFIVYCFIELFTTLSICGFATWNFITEVNCWLSGMIHVQSNGKSYASNQDAYFFHVFGSYSYQQQIWESFEILNSGQVFGCLFINYVFKTHSTQKFTRRGKTWTNSFEYLSLLMFADVFIRKNCFFEVNKSIDAQRNHVFGTVTMHCKVITHRKGCCVCYFWKSLNTTHV